MKKYRLKKEAIPYFRTKLATTIWDYSQWQEIGVDNVALEEVEPCHIEYGHRTGSDTKRLSGFDSDDGGRFRFTIVFPSMKHKEYNEFSKGKLMGDLMRHMQELANRYFEDYVNTDEHSVSEQ